MCCLGTTHHCCYQFLLLENTALLSYHFTVLCRVYNTVTTKQLQNAKQAWGGIFNHNSVSAFIARQMHFLLSSPRVHKQIISELMDDKLSYSNSLNIIYTDSLSLYRFTLLSFISFASLFFCSFIICSSSFSLLRFSTPLVLFFVSVLCCDLILYFIKCKQFSNE